MNPAWKSVKDAISFTNNVTRSFYKRLPYNFQDSMYWF